MDCSQYENQFEKLKDLVNELLSNKMDFNLDRINTLSCLLCKNFDKELVPCILPHLEKYVSENAYSYIHWYALGRINQIVKNDTRAEEAYIKAINLNPLNTDLIERIAKFYMTTSRWEKALDYCNKLVTAIPDKRQVVNGIMLEAFYRSGMYKEAIQNFESGVDLVNLNSIYKAMHSYVLLNRFEDAIKLFHTAKLDDSDISYEILYLAYDAYFKLKDYDNALKILLKLSQKITISTKVI